ncbi:MAG: hypothetical protein M3144_03480, partial [Actinomycetota bacterium]|nr:hypothetical protein [Actinomycetota bacterium]
TGPARRLERVEAERWSGMGAGDLPVGGDLGQPLFAEGLFAGMEHPGAENLAGDGGWSLGLPVAVDLGPDSRWTAPPVVVGGAPPGHERSAFWDELDRLRAQPARMVVLANNWYQLGAVGRMDEASVVAELEGFGEVASRTGLALDWYCLDDPWDGFWEPEIGIWGRLDPERFPGGLARLQQGTGSRIGLWLSPWGGYFDRHDARVSWGRRHGFEIDERAGVRGPNAEAHRPCLCPAGAEYRGHVGESMRRLTAAGVGYWKIDGVQFDCQGAGHGHAVGTGGRTDQMDRFAALLDSVRAVRPDVFLAFTTGSNPSPWWLRHADVLWRGGLDDDAPETYDGGHLDRFATYIDSCLDAYRTTAMPVSAVVTFSVVENAVRAYRDVEAEAWDRHCWFLAGRGSLHHDLYVAPDSLSEREWDVLAEALAWARRHQRVLARSRMVGGRPQAGEPYGFVSVAGGEVIACVRNPSARPQDMSLTTRDLLGGTVEDLRPVWGRTVGRTLQSLELDPFEVAVLSGRWRPGTPPGPPG